LLAHGHTCCTGLLKAEADAVAFIICARYAIAIPHAPASPATWAGTDPRAQPHVTLLAAGDRISVAATTISRHLDRSLPSQPGTLAARQERTAASSPGASVVSPGGPFPPPAQETAGQAAETPAASLEPDPRAVAILRDAGDFYAARLAGSWVPGYLTSRGITQETARNWQVGYAPATWTALTGHLQAAGYTGQEIEAAGLARRSSRGTLIDHFRDRVMLPVRDARGRIAGFTGRARPGCGPATPKYLNSPETILYKKGDLLFGLWEAHGALNAGAVPVIVEGPFDAIAVTMSADGSHAGLAPCGTALTTRQAALLAEACDLAHSGTITAFDPDQAGQKAAIRAYRILRPHTASLRSVGLGERDPAKILEDDGPNALRQILITAAEPLLNVVIEAEVSRVTDQTDDAESPFRAMRAAAVTLTALLPADTAAQIRQATAGAELAAVDDQLHPIAIPQLPGIARTLPADIAFQATRLADRLGFTTSDVLIEIANAATRQASHPPPGAAACLAASGFPCIHRQTSASGDRSPSRSATPACTSAASYSAMAVWSSSATLRPR
jgi:DNA primase catalytic core